MPCHDVIYLSPNFPANWATSEIVTGAALTLTTVVIHRGCDITQWYDIKTESFLFLKISLASNDIKLQKISYLYFIIIIINCGM